MDKKALSERDICTKFIAPAIAQAGWDLQHLVREELTLRISKPASSPHVPGT